MKKILLTISLFLIGTVTSYAQQNLGVNQPNPTAKIHITNTENQNSLQVDDEDGDASPFVIDADGNAQVGGKLTVDSMRVIQNASDGAVLTSDANGNATWNKINIASFREENPLGTEVTVVSGWQTRQLNTISSNIGTDISINLTNHEITVQPGVYKIKAYGLAYKVQENQLRLKQIGTNATLSLGMLTYVETTVNVSTVSILEDVIEFSTETTFILEHYVYNVSSGPRLGMYTPVGTGENGVASSLVIEKIK
jgi:hypothetical protein